MQNLPKNLQHKLQQRLKQNTLRNLGIQNNMVDFSSNDYLGFSISKPIFEAAHLYLTHNGITQNGSTGSRLLSGNHKLYIETESLLCAFHNSPDSLIYNSGYDANLGFFSCVPQREDIILYDEFIHASIRDGISLSNARAYKFKHNNLEDLEEKILRISIKDNLNIYIVTESVFSMDGDSPDLVKIAQLSNKYNAKLIIDEAHAIGVIGENGIGMVSKLELENHVFARIITFGKAIGCHGAAILSSQELKQYLINFSRSFIYTTALPPHTLATILSAYKELLLGSKIKKLNQNILYFKSEIQRLSLENSFIESYSAIHSCIISSNKKVKNIASHLQEKGYNIKPILAPTVPKGKERLRFCLHAYNSEEEITKVLQLLATFVLYE